MLNSFILPDTSVAYRTLKIWPDGLKGRWFYFLKHLLPNTHQNGTTVAVIIRDALRDFVADTNCTYVSFHAQPDVYNTLPAGIDYRADISPDPAAAPAKPYPASITLVCRNEIPHGVNEPILRARTGERAALISQHLDGRANSVPVVELLGRTVS